MKEHFEKNSSLQAIGKELDLHSILFQKNKEIEGKKKIANAIEAIIGAIFLSKGYKKARIFVKNRVVTPKVLIQRLNQIRQNQIDSI